MPLELVPTWLKGNPAIDIGCPYPWTAGSDSNTANDPTFANFFMVLIVMEATSLPPNVLDPARPAQDLEMTAHRNGALPAPNGVRLTLA